MAWPGPGLSANLRGTLPPSCLISWPRQGSMRLLISSYFCGPGPCSWFFPFLLFIVWYANRKLHYLRDQSLAIPANICQHCQKVNAVHAKFCINCGLPLGAGGEFFQICGNCQVRVPHNANFCFKCGHKLPQIEVRSGTGVKPGGSRRQIIHLHLRRDHEPVLDDVAQHFPGQFNRLLRGSDVLRQQAEDSLVNRPGNLEGFFSLIKGWFFRVSRVAKFPGILREGHRTINEFSQS